MWCRAWKRLSCFVVASPTQFEAGARRTGGFVLRSAPSISRTAGPHSCTPFFFHANGPRNGTGSGVLSCRKAVGACVDPLVSVWLTSAEPALAAISTAAAPATTFFGTVAI
jgi:hypothetical protein